MTVATAISQNEEVYMVGVQGSANFGPVKLFGEFDYFDGDAVTDKVDAFGDPAVRRRFDRCW